MMTRRNVSTPNHDLAAERAIVGASLRWPHRLEGVADDLASEDFYGLEMRHIWEAVQELLSAGITVDPVTVLDRVGPSIESAYLVGLIGEALPPQREHVEIILRHSAARQVRQIGSEAEFALSQGDDPYEVAASSATELDRVGSMSAYGLPESLTFPELIEKAEDCSPWLIPGLLRNDGRCVIVASEGLGKSTLLRQIAICAAQGINPLRFDAIDPIRVLIVDAENSPAAIAETGKRLDSQARRTAGNAYDPSRCKVWTRQGGLDIRSPRDRADLVREIRDQRPQLVVAGPVYKLGPSHDGERHEEGAEGILAVLDELRTRFEFALILEHHAPKPQGGAREMLPYGSQRWMAWPELGITLKANKSGGVDLGRFRGDRLRSWWPDRLERSGVWPWTGVWQHGMPSLADYA